MSTEDISFSDPAPGNVAAPTPARREGKDVVPSTELRDDGVSESTASIIPDIMNALAKDIQQFDRECSEFKDIFFGHPAPENVAALTRAWREGKDAVLSIKQQFGYVMSSKRYARDLQKEVGKLAYEAERIHNAMRDTRDNLQKVYGHVIEWQANAEKALKEAKDLLGDFEKASKTCCYGTLPDSNVRYRFSRKAKDKIEGIRQLARECSEFKELNGIPFGPPAPGNATLTASASSSSTPIRDDGVFESRAEIIRDIMDVLANYSNRVVGIHGMGGVGKSTLLADAERRIRERKLFDLVAKADVSEHQDIKRIQEEIAHALGLSEIKKEEYVSVRAGLLRRRLQYEERMKRKVLIILDNLWAGLDLNKVGIPCEHDNKVVGCKLLLTSRDRDVLRSEMRCDRDFLLGGLPEEEARRLFGRLVGDKAHDDEFKPLVDEALQRCAGLPFLIVAMAKLFKDADLSEWKDVLKQIKRSQNEGIVKVINNMLQLSYDHLKVEQAKSLLRLCVVYGVLEPSLENLMRYGMGLGLFGENSSMEEARNKLSSLLRTLRASSLLLENGDADGFKIHDLVREFVASVASRDQPLLMCKDKDKFITDLPKDKLKNCRAICFPYVDMEELPEELDCPELQIFLLFTNNKSLGVPYSLFNSMRKLMVLNLTGIHLTRLPSSFQLSEKLHTLCLDGCTLDDVAILGKLKGLQILSFAKSEIQRLPKEIRQLTELRLLDLNHCSRLQMIESGVLGSLIKLEELYMKNSFDQWNVVEQAPPINASLIELNNMKNLRTLYACIPNPTMLPEDLNVEKLTKYGIRIGGRRRSSRKGSRTLELKLNLVRDILRKGCIRTALDKTDDLYLDALNGIEQSICELFPEGFPNLKHLHVENSPSAHYVFRLNHQFRERILQDAFPSLETIRIARMDNLRMISDNQAYFQHLKTLDVSRCGSLTSLFPASVARGLMQLEELEINECGIVELLEKEGLALRFVFPKLTSLRLKHLPELKCIYTGRGTHASHWPALKTLEVDGCDKVEIVASQPRNEMPLHKQPLFLIEKDAFPSLEILRIARMGNLQMISDNQAYFQRLKTLHVSHYDRLSYVFTRTIVENMVELAELKISYCEILTEVISDEGGKEGGFGVSNQLNNMELERLTILRCFAPEEGQGSAAETIRFPNLLRVELECLPNLTSFLAGNNRKLELPKLEELSIANCPTMTSIGTLFPRPPSFISRLPADI